jgi:hypothetical protein
MSSGKMNWVNLPSYVVRPSDMDKFQTYIMSLAKGPVGASRTAGIIFGCRVTPGVGMQINVSAGLAQFSDGTIVEIPASTVTIPPSNAALPRIDRLELSYTQTNGDAVVDVNNLPKVLDFVFAPSIVPFSGVAAAIPLVPVLTIGKISLALISLIANQNVVGAASISQNENNGFDTSSIVLGDRNSFIRFNQTIQKLQFSNDGITFQSLGSGGGGGGGAVWQPVAGLEPIENFDLNEKVWKFSKDGAQSLSIFVKVPSGYISGAPIVMKLDHFSSSFAGSWKFQTVATLIRTGSDPITSSANQKASSNGDITNVISNLLTEVSYDLTTLTGLINGVAVSPGDLLLVTLSRVAPIGVEDLLDVAIIPSSTEVSFS